MLEKKYLIHNCAKDITLLPLQNKDFALVPLHMASIFHAVCIVIAIYRLHRSIYGTMVYKNNASYPIITTMSGPLRGIGMGRYKAKPWL